MGSVRVAIVGVGNCASSLVQGVEYYKDKDPAIRVPGLMHVTFGPYHVRDLEFVAAFDVDAKKVGRDLAEAIGASENNTIKLCDVPPTGITVQRGPTMDGLGEYYQELITESDDPPADVAAALREARADIRLRILEGRRTRLEERLDGVRAAMSRTRERLDSYTLELHRHGLESVEREVRWLNELIASERESGAASPPPSARNADNGTSPGPLPG